jgi:hypothetical protein
MKQLLKFSSLPTREAIQGACRALLIENPQTYPQELWITRALHFC